MANSKHIVYKSDGPHMKGAVRVGAGQGPGGSSAGQPPWAAGNGTSPVPVGAGGNVSQSSQLGNAVVGSMPTVNQINVSVNPDGTIGTSVEVADATPVTGPGASVRSSSRNAHAGEVGVQTGWVKVQNGYKYYFIDESGNARCKTGWHYEINADGTKAWYYLDEDPLNKEWMVTGWKKITGPKGTYWYYFRPDGKMSIYWEWLNGLWYYLEPQDDNGNMTIGWREINGEWYYFIPDEDAGYMMIGWLEIKGKWYYFYNSDDRRGIMAANHMVDHTDGKKYYLGTDGAMVTKKDKQYVTYKGVTYEVGEDGACTKTGGITDSIPAAYRRYYDNNINLLSQITTLNTNKFARDISKIKEVYEDNIEIYEVISNETGVPPELIAAIHYRESGCNFDTYLHNGQKLGKPTTIVPVGILFYDFHNAAVDALNREQNSKGFHLTPDADIATMMTFAEIYNGTGYTKNRNIASPYVYSGTNVYTSGKYVSDGKYDANVVDAQPGVYLLVTTLLKI